MKQLPFLFLLSLVLVITSEAVAQKVHNASYYGVVFSSSDSSRLEYVHVHLEGSSVGVVTNTAGEFQIKFKDSLLIKNLTFSCIGYKKLTLPINEVLSDKSLHDSIFLHPDTVMLPEAVIIASRQDTLDVFFKKVIDRVPFNYPMTGYYLSGFYREISQNGDSSSRLIEAAISIQHPGYSGKEENVRIRVDQLRKSDDFIQYSWTKTLLQFLFGVENNLIQTYQTDFLRRKGLIRGGSLFTYELRLDSILGTGDNRVAKIGFESKDNVNAPFFAGEIYVSLSDFAIKRMVYSWVADPKFTFPNQDLVFYNGQYRFRKIVEYHKGADAKYYPFFISSFEPISGVTGAKGKLQFRESIIMINEVLTDKSDYSKIRRREREEEDEDIYKKEFPYDAKFWEQYNMAVINPIGENQRFSLEKKQNLKAQFQKNGKNKKR